MGLFDDAVPGGNIAKPLIVALGALLVGKLMSGSSAPTEPAPPSPGSIPQSTQGGGSFGGLSGLLDRLSNSGHSEAVSSWVGPGQNAPIQPGSLGSALGQTTVSDLAKSAGMSEEQFLAQLSRVLPGVVDKLTPDGRIPNQAQILSALGH